MEEEKSKAEEKPNTEEKPKAEENAKTEEKPKAKEKNQVRVRIPQITDIETAIRLYYERIELTNADIRELFGSLGSNTIAKLKKKARELMERENTPIWNAQSVNTEVAFKAWGLNITDLERRYKKLSSMKRG